MSTSNIHTTDPIALRYLMTEPIFTAGHDNTGREQGGETPPTITGKAGQPAIDFAFYGKNKRRFLFLVNDGQHQWMSTAALDAFTKTLVALQLSVDDVALLNLHALPAPPKKEALISLFQPKVMVLLGVDPQSVGFDSQPAGQVTTCDGISLFPTGTFDGMLADAEMKRLFWITIKTLLV